MSNPKKKDPSKKLKQKLQQISGNYQWSDLTKLFAKLGYEKQEREGSRVAFYNREKNCLIILHKPHPGNIVKKGAQRAVIKHLNDNGENL